MIGLDTNILIRYLTQDDAIQASRVNALMERGLTPAEPGYISLVALAETVWVLRKSYKISGDPLAKIIEGLIEAKNLVIQNEPEVVRALVAFRSGQGSISDALIGIFGREAGCKTTLTFDRKALRLEGFELL